VSIHLLVADGVGILLALTGFNLAFRQRDVRRRLDKWRGRRGLPLLWPGASGADDPLHYALIISGTMVMAFGIILFGFTTMLALA